MPPPLSVPAPTNVLPSSQEEWQEALGEVKLQDAAKRFDKNKDDALGNINETSRAGITHYAVVTLESMRTWMRRVLGLLSGLDPRRTVQRVAAAFIYGDSGFLPDNEDYGDFYIITAKLSLLVVESLRHSEYTCISDKLSDVDNPIHVFQALKELHHALTPVTTACQALTAVRALMDHDDFTPSSLTTQEQITKHRQLRNSLKQNVEQFKLTDDNIEALKYTAKIVKSFPGHPILGSFVAIRAAKDITLKDVEDFHFTIVEHLTSVAPQEQNGFGMPALGAHQGGQQQQPKQRQHRAEWYLVLPCCMCGDAGHAGSKCQVPREELPKCQTCSLRHATSECRQPNGAKCKNQSSSSYRLSLQAATSAPLGNWRTGAGSDAFSTAAVVDSGASTNIVSSAELVSDMKPSAKTFIGLNGAVGSVAAGTLTYQAKNGHELPPMEAMVVPSVPLPVLSVRALTNLGYEVHYLEHEAYILAPDNTRMDMTKQHGIYTLPGRIVPHNSAGFLVSTQHQQELPDTLAHEVPVTPPASPSPLQEVPDGVSTHRRCQSRHQCHRLSSRR
jgi:hypothetical protein